MKYISELRNDFLSQELEVSELVERIGKDKSSVESGNSAKVSNLFDAMLLLREFGDTDEFLDIIARNSKFIDSVRWSIEYWGPKLSPGDTLKDTMLGFMIKEWVTNDDSGYPYYILPNFELQARTELLQDIGITIFNDIKGENKEFTQHAPYAVLAKHLEDRMIV